MKGKPRNGLIGNYTHNEKERISYDKQRIDGDKIDSSRYGSYGAMREVDERKNNGSHDKENKKGEEKYY